LSTSSVFTYNVGADFFPMPFADLDAIIEFTKYHKINYIYLKAAKQNIILKEGLDIMALDSSNSGIILMGVDGQNFLYKVIYDK